MSRTVTLPLWLALLAGLLALWTALDRLLIPSVRWVIRRRVNRLIDRINTTLKIQIPPFNLTRRDVLIDRLSHDPPVLEAAASWARQEGAPREVAAEKVRRYAREIVPSFNAYLYFRLGYAAARAVARSLYRVRLGYSDEAGLAGIGEDSTVVFLVNHRSNMDYILVAYLAAEKAALSYAVGEWARIWPLETLIRSMGAYFVRRNSGDPLYRKVLERYIAMATAAGVTQAVFPEGGLSRDGRLRPPRLGILDYMLRAFDPSGGRDIVFIPVGINYDRVFEDRTFLLELDPAWRRPGGLRAAATTAGFVWRNLLLRASNKWHRFGYACVNFGSPISLRRRIRSGGVDYASLPKEARFPEVEAFARELMEAVARVIPVLPVPLVASVLVREPERAWSELELKAEVLREMERLDAIGAHVYVPRGDQDYAITVGLRMLTLRRLVSESDGMFAPRAEELTLLNYYASSIAHLVAESSPSSRLRAGEREGSPLASLRTRGEGSSPSPRPRGEGGGEGSSRPVG